MPTDVATIVIPTYNGKHLLERHLPSVMSASERSDLEIIVVDNASTDGTGEWLSEIFPAVRHIRLETNTGSGGAYNAGAREAGHPIVIFLNNDVDVEPDFVGPLVDDLSDPGLFAVSSKILIPTRGNENESIHRISFPSCLLSLSRVKPEPEDRRFLIPYACGAACAVRKKDFLDLGGFDPLFAPGALEDVDLGYRAWKRGCKVLYEPCSIVLFRPFELVLAVILGKQAFVVGFFQALGKLSEVLRRRRSNRGVEVRDEEIVDLINEQHDSG
ncbi:MAG: glycosyltransferase family 2 protein [Armatimonadetes bacterium]|nr:glycosyltransferase family 2 protein [Armatimonadota bacterium]